MISVKLDKRSARLVNDMLRNAEERVDRAEELFLGELAGVLRAAVQEKAPTVPGAGGRPYKYATALRVATVEGVSRVDACVAVWLQRRGRELRAEELMRTALIVRPAAGAPGWVRALASAGPWPADLIPFRLSPQQARVVARSIRPDEAQALRSGIWARRAEIGDALRQGGAPPFRWGRTSEAAGTRIYVDMAWEALRAEFGWAGAPQRPAWRDAVRAMMAAVPGAMRKVAEYLVDGDEGRFDTAATDSIAFRKVRTGVGFQRELMPFVPKRAR